MEDAKINALGLNVEKMKPVLMGHVLILGWKFVQLRKWQQFVLKK